MEQPAVPAPARTFRPQHLAWGIGSLGTITMISAVSSLYLFYLVSVIKLPPALAGTLIFASKIVDMISDPVMGLISDRSNTRWGRRRPFLLAGAFACAASMVLIFSIPAEPGSGALSQAVIVELSLVFYALALTVFNVPYLAMPAEMTSDTHERSVLMSYRAFFLVGGNFVGAATAGLLLRRLGGAAEAYWQVGCFLAAVVFLSMLTTFVGTRRAPHTRYTRTRVPTGAQLRLFLVNRPFLTLGAVKAVQFLQLATSSAVTLFFFVSFLQKDEGLLLPFGLAVSAGSVGSIRLWLPYIRRVGKRRAFMTSAVLQACVYLSWLLASPGEGLPVFILRAALMGAFSCGILVCSQSMIVDTVDYDRRLSGINREGVFSSIFSFIEKSTHAAGPLVVGVILGMFGFDASLPRGTAQPESAQDAILLGMAVLPALCSAIMLIGIYFYDLDDEKLAGARLHELARGAGSGPNAGKEVLT